MRHLLLLALLASATALAAPAQESRARRGTTQPINLDAASSDVDYRTNKVVFRDVVIRQGDIKLSAQRAEATGLNFEDSRWTFEGTVRIDVEKRGSLRSDNAVVDFRNNRLDKATITGSPAEFEQRRTDPPLTARGRAALIEYDVAGGTVRLSEDAWLTDGRNEISGPLLVYSIREERVQAAGRDGGKTGPQDRVRITIVPREGEGRAP